MNSVTIITAVCNKLELTQRFYDSLVSNPPRIPWDMVWVDDGSMDGTREWLEALPKDYCRVLLNASNVGFSSSNNAGARIASGDALCFLNNDLVLTKNWFVPLYCNLLENNNIGMVGNIQLSVKTGKIDHAGVTYDLIGRPDHYLKGRPLSAISSNGRFLTTITAACCMIRRDLFFSVGGFDESYRNGCEDVDLCLRLGQMGYRHWVDYRSVVYHHVSSSPGRKDHEKQNLALFLQRWGHLTSKWGQEDWPRNYLSKHLHCPWKLNGTKTVDALLRLAGLKHGDSKWAAKKRAEIMEHIPPEAERRPV